MSLSAPWINKPLNEKGTVVVVFKKCPLCHHPWENREKFLSDPELEIIGYQVSFESIQDGLFLFNHQCKTTLALKVTDFDDLYEGVRYEQVATGTDDCSGYCLHIAELRPCGAECKYAYVRDIISTIRKWPKEDKT
jgi:hypothetical protein